MPIVQDDIQKEAMNDLLDGPPPVEEEEGEIIDETTDVVDGADKGSVESIEASVEAELDVPLSTESKEDVTTEEGKVADSPGAKGDLEVIDDIEGLRQRIAELSSAPDIPVIPKGEEVNPLDAFKDDVAYITEENLENIAQDPLILNAVMNDVRRQTAENILSLVPVLINSAVQAQAKRDEVYNEFYSEHKELIPYKAYVSSVATEIQKKMLDKTPEEILDVVARSVKASLKLDKVKPASENKGGVKPALRKSKGGGRTNTSTVEKSSMQTEIDDMLN